MNDVQVHLLLNHFPIIGTLIGACFLLFGVVRNQINITQAGLLTIIIVALITIPAFMSGEGAEHIAEEIEGVSHDSIEAHEEAAVPTFWMMEILGVISLIGLILGIKDHSKRRMVATICMILAWVVFGMMVNVGYTGGHIRHPEIDQIPGYMDTIT